VDTDWMRERLQGFLDLCEAYARGYRQSGYEYNDGVRELDHRAEQEEPTVRQILRALDPALDDGFVGIGYDTSNAERRVRQALGVLRDRDEWKVRLAPDAPSLTADEMHPVIWAAAAPVWETGQYKTAAQSAAVSLSAHVKARVGSHLNDRELMQQVFSHDPPKGGQVRLHFPGDPADKNWLSRQQGLHLVAQGAFAGIRNIAVHDETPWAEHEALEHLAVLSVVARWADLTEERTASEE